MPFVQFLVAHYTLLHTIRIYSEHLLLHRKALWRQFCCRLTPHLRGTIWITSRARKSPPPPYYALAAPRQQPDQHSHPEFVRLVSVYKNFFMQISSLKLPHINGEIRIHVTRDWLICFLFRVYNIFDGVLRKHEVGRDIRGGRNETIPHRTRTGYMSELWPTRFSPKCIYRAQIDSIFLGITIFRERFSIILQGNSDRRQKNQHFSLSKRI
jgi:hypothetical protein